MNYFTQFWDEERDDENASWGTSTWYFETNEEDEVIKQVTIYQSGKTLKYSAENAEDEFGGLCMDTLTIDDCDGDVISKEEFYTIW